MNDFKFVSRGAYKLLYAIDFFKINIKQTRCVDLGCNVGGFTQVLLEKGALEVFSIDTAYGVLDWKLRNDPRVHVMERTNALHCLPPKQLCDIVTIDLSWTLQSKALPVATKWCRHGGHIISLIKPHYEATASDPTRQLKNNPIKFEEAKNIAKEVSKNIPSELEMIELIESPVKGAKSSKKGYGNHEFLLILKRKKQI